MGSTTTLGLSLTLTIIVINLTNKMKQDSFGGLFLHPQLPLQHILPPHHQIIQVMKRHISTHTAHALSK